jgi:uncharacterized protein (DUF362 family)
MVPGGPTFQSGEQAAGAPVRTGMSRREVLALGGTALVGGSIATGLHQWNRHERGRRAAVYIAKCRSYEADIATTMVEGLGALGIDRAHVRGRRILLKPNLVETAEGHAHINTHPAVVVAAAEAFRRLDAASVLVAEAQGHRRDSRLVLEQSGMGKALADANVAFVDLNHDQVATAPNAGSWTSMQTLYLPQTLVDADWVVSMPKLKTHHWAGLTCAMKNLFGVMPGIVYGWPKNVLHYHGIPESILDINATVRPRLAIVDGIIGMEGDGPIMGTPKQAGCLILGTNAAAVDATAARVMQLNPYAIRYLTGASGVLGPIHETNIAQRGEPISAVGTPFALLDAPHLRGIARG